MRSTTQEGTLVTGIKYSKNDFISNNHLNNRKVNWDIISLIKSQGKGNTSVENDNYTILYTLSQIIFIKNIYYYKI